MIEEFTAPWGLRLIVITAAASILFVGIVGVLSRRLAGLGRVIVVGLIMTLIAAMISTTVVTYQLNDEAITIQQVGSEIAIPLQSLRSVNAVPNAMDGSRRTNGNGGIFSITGYYNSDSLGSYRAYVTDPVRTVVMRTSRGTVVLSPDRPAEFVSRVISGLRAGRWLSMPDGGQVYRRADRVELGFERCGASEYRVGGTRLRTVPQ
jgi:hypothetical protein